jgi:hypothetical protein
VRRSCQSHQPAVVPFAHLVFDHHKPNGSSKLFQRPVIQRRLGHHMLQLPVLLFQLLQLPFSGAAFQPPAPLSRFVLTSRSPSARRFG